MKNRLARDLDEIVARVPRHVWHALKNERILITGGTGFVGTWLVESLAWANERLGLNARTTLLSRASGGDQQSFIFPPGEFRFVIHAAPETPGDPNVTGTRRVLEFARQSRAQRLLFTSSGAVYKHTTEYADLKRASEKLVSTFDRAVVARLFAFIGPYLKLEANFAVGNFMRDVLDRKPITISGDGTPIRTYLYAADLAAWLWTLLVEGEGTYDVGGDVPISILGLAHQVAKLTVPETEVGILGESRSDRYVPDTRRARTELNLQTWTPLDEAIRRTYNWHLGL